MQPQVKCLSCEFLKACLRNALRQEGLIAPSIMETPVVSRTANFLKRWSDRKLSDKRSGSAASD